MQRILCFAAASFGVRETKEVFCFAEQWNQWSVTLTASSWSRNRYNKQIINLRNYQLHRWRTRVIELLRKLTPVRLGVGSTPQQVDFFFAFSLLFFLKPKHPQEHVLSMLLKLTIFKFVFKSTFGECKVRSINKAAGKTFESALKIAEFWHAGFVLRNIAPKFFCCVVQCLFIFIEREANKTFCEINEASRFSSWSRNWYCRQIIDLRNCQMLRWRTRLIELLRKLSSVQLVVGSTLCQRIFFSFSLLFSKPKLYPGTYAVDTTKLHRKKVCI